MEFLKSNVEICIPDGSVKRVAALKVAMRQMTSEYGCKAVAIQCWSSMQEVLQVMPCMANSLMTDEGIPVVCETDIHGAITAIMAQAAAMGKTPVFFADWTVRHPENDNGELLQHCGPWPISLVKEGMKAKLGRPFAFPEHCPGSAHMELKGGEMTMLRFDGPYNQGTYVWIEVENWVKLEEKLVTGPYVHHCVGIHGNIMPVIYEAIKYIPGLRVDFYDEKAEEKVQAWLRGDPR